MTRKAFEKLVKEVKDHSVFRRGKRGPRQDPVEYQLMVLLDYRSLAGSSASSERCWNHFHMGYGCRDLYIKRAIWAICESMSDKYYHWPDEAERKQIAFEFQQRYNLPNAILIVDGTTFRLMHRPNREDVADFKGRKEGYTITNLFFTDLKRQIRYYIAGWAGCAHDNHMWVNSSLYHDQSNKFSHNEYMMGDSAFDNGPHMVTTYRTPIGGCLCGSRSKFNDILLSP